MDSKEIDETTMTLTFFPPFFFFMYFMYMNTAISYFG